MQVTFGPKVARRVLRYELERLCTQAGKTPPEVSERLGITRPGFLHIIAGRNLPSKPALEILMDFFGRPDKLSFMLELLSVAKLKFDQQGAVSRDANPSASMNDFELLLGLESYATTIEVFEPAVVTGLLQTREYAEALITYYASMATNMDVADYLSIRLQRQTVITRDVDRANLWFVVEEQALRRPVGNSDVMAGQLKHLLTTSERANITVQIIPRKVGIHPALDGAFKLLRFNDDWRIAYEETRPSAYYYDAPGVVEDYAQVMNHLRHLALTPKQSQALMSAIRKEVQSLQ